MKNILKILSIIFIIQLLMLPVSALDLDSTVNDSNRSNYTKTTTSQTIQNTQKNTIQDISKIQTAEPSKKTTIKQPNTSVKQDSAKPILNEINKTVSEQQQEKTVLPTVPQLPKNATSSSVAPINTQYSGKVPNSDAIIPCNIKVSDLIIDDSVVKSKIASKSGSSKITNKNDKKYNPNLRTARLPKGTQIRMVNQSKITDSLYKGQKITFLSTQDINTPYFKIPAKTKFTTKVIDSHKPQLSCNGGLVALRIESALINGYTCPMNAGIIKLKTNNVHFSNLKGEHTYLKTTCKKAKWGQNMYKKWANTSHKLANKGAGVVLAPFPYLGGCVLACASTVSSPVTALLGKGGNLSIPANTTFTVKFYDDAIIKF